MDVSGCPLRRRGDDVFYDRAEAAWGIMFLVVVADLLLEVVPAPVVSCFLGVMTCWGGFLRRSLVGKKFERLDSDLNESTKNIGTNSQKKFIFTSNCNMDLKQSRRNNRKDSGFT